jgi:hypothetical protein
VIAREPRDTGEQPTRPDAVDWDTYTAPDDDRPNNRYVPHAIPDHGLRPRRPKRPSRAIWKLDPNNHYRPADDYFSSTLHEEPRLSEAEQRKIDTVRLLTKTARANAPKLEWRNDDSIAEFIDTQAMPDATFIAASLPPADRARVLEKFVEVLWDQIEFHRQNRRKKNLNTKT